MLPARRHCDMMCVPSPRYLPVNSARAAAAMPYVAITAAAAGGYATLLLLAALRMGRRSWRRPP
jgi:hypothetical protein